jgi:hypothetical protein
MYKLYFDIRDIFRAPRLALSGKKILIQGLGLLIGYVGYLILTYVAFLISGMSISDIWEGYRFFPLWGFTFSHWLSWLIFIIGCLFLVAAWLLASAAVGKVTYEQLKGDEFYSAKDSLKFVKNHGKTVLLTPFSLIVFSAIFVVGGIIVGLLGKIPYLGELGLGIFYAVPIFVVAFFVIYTLFIFVFSLLLTPAVVAVIKEDIFETIVQLFSSIWSQPWRFFLYTALAGVLAKLGTFVLGYFTFRSLQLISWSCGVLMKEKLLDIMDGALSYVILPSRFFDFFTNIFPGINFRFHLPEIGFGAFLSWSESISAFLIGITLILIIFGVVSYGLATISTGQTLTYIIIRKKKDEENLLERKTEEEEQEERLAAEEEEKKEEEKPAEEKAEVKTEAETKTEGEKDKE